ncbi:hypothetical protein [Herbaspirillum sp. YR522]|uniref:hypothetical protein n=1 Tax=Herbaspirillum sp. YR522 TaxID=1144342 RepID=UPI00026FC50A|nr:hypothetical protein [Herbaspirillum sp. YR522]EJN02581.1 hypothetical protein PMI40_03119 [Herbaspirillum sp. YR522]
MNRAEQARLVRFWQQMDQLHAIRKRRAQTAVRMAQQQVRQLQDGIARNHAEADHCRHLLQQAHSRFLLTLVDMKLRSVQHLDQAAAINRERQELARSLATLHRQAAQARDDVAQARHRMGVADQRSQHAIDQLRENRRRLRDLQEEDNG